MELIDMQKAFVGFAQGAWKRIARARDFDKTRLQKTALQRGFAPVSEGEVSLVRMRAAATPAESPNYALPARSL